MKEEKTVGQITVEKNVGGIEGLCVITPAVHGDARGYFMETYNEREMKEAGFDMEELLHLRPDTLKVEEKVVPILQLRKK